MWGGGVIFVGWRVGNSVLWGDADCFWFFSSTIARFALLWGISSVGRALALQASGQGFKSPILHKIF